MTIWLLPALVMAAGLVPVGIFALRASEEAEHLRRELRGAGQLKPLLAEVRTAGQVLRASVKEMTRL